MYWSNPHLTSIAILIAEAGKTKLDQHTSRLAANLSSEVDLLTRQAKTAIDTHTGFYFNI